MFNVMLTSDHLYGKMAVYLAVAGDVFDGVFLCCPFSHEVSWMRSGTKLRQFQRIFLPTFLSNGRTHGAPHCGHGYVRGFR